MSLEPPTDLLVLAAHLPELAGLRTLLGEELRGEVAGVRVVAKPVGIGLSAAASGSSYRIETIRPRAVVLIGTCGAYAGSGVAIGEVVVARRLHLVSIAELEGSGALPAPMSTTMETDAALSLAIARGSARAVDVATTLAITTDDGLAGRIAAARACQVEHLEAFAVAQSASAARTRIATLFGVANQVGSSARDEWRIHHRTAGQAAAALVAAFVQSGAPGL